MLPKFRFTRKSESPVQLALSSAFDKRLTLFPQGQPPDPEHRKRCAELALWCGGDIGRVIDAPVSSLDRFAGYIERIRGLQEGTEPALVMLTQTNPLALTVVDLRRRLEKRIPVLRTSRWVIHVDPDADPFFSTMALRLGHLTGELAEAPLWLGPQDSPYLVVSSGMRDRNAVAGALEELDETILAASGERMVKLQRRRMPGLG
ncbi:MAG: hypothetical protein ACOC1F_04300 [Myxococcota bacterium]